VKLEKGASAKTHGEPFGHKGKTNPAGGTLQERRGGLPNEITGERVFWSARQAVGVLKK